ncbi:MAG: hypothetical protein R3B72_11940 [Polyangiaceae bacterium]
MESACLAALRHPPPGRRGLFLIAMLGITILGLASGLLGCNDAKATCEAICEKVGECLPGQMDVGKLSADEQGAVKAEVEKTVTECKQTCDKDDGDLSEADKKGMAKAKECLSKDCAAFDKCISGL